MSEVQSQILPSNQTHGDQIHFALNDYSQYHKWAFLMKNLLDDHNVWDELNTHPVESKVAFRLIVKNVHADSLDLIMDTTSSIMAWKILADEFAGTSIPTQRAALNALLNFRAGKNMHDEVKRIKELKRLLISALGNKEEIKVDQLVAVCFLEALPDEYSGTKAILENETSIKLEDICSKVIRSPVGFTQESLVNKASISKCNHRKYSADKCWFCHPKLRPVCEVCKEKGEKKFYHQTGSRFCSNKENPIQAYSCSLRSSESSKFILDSGCTDHMIKDARLLCNRKPCNLGIVTASNQTIPASGKGDLAMSTQNTMIKFNNVVACESLTLTLSISFIKAMKGDGLYITKMIHIEANQIKVSKMTWDRRMGHLNLSDMDRLNNLATGYLVGEKEIEDCLPCIIEIQT